MTLHQRHTEARTNRSYFIPGYEVRASKSSRFFFVVVRLTQSQNVQVYILGDSDVGICFRHRRQEIPHTLARGRKFKGLSVRPSKLGFRKEYSAPPHY
ncbi:hypothetical protein TNCT_405491 [Trichonephila clavata]|uniref:Uncharacterized protein n=1 Tax=Trichonephila clavata TaxID=2740835 RepID=A0A8X6HMS0_TRICU|nr:hypothetical protein TNCT_405491 [Trichonephila clavata]